MRTHIVMIECDRGGRALLELFKQDPTVRISGEGERIFASFPTIFLRNAVAKVNKHVEQISVQGLEGLITIPSLGVC